MGCGVRHQDACFADNVSHTRRYNVTVTVAQEASVLPSGVIRIEDVTRDGNGQQHHLNKRQRLSCQSARNLPLQLGTLDRRSNSQESSDSAFQKCCSMDTKILKTDAPSSKRGVVYVRIGLNHLLQVTHTFWLRAQHQNIRVEHTERLQASRLASLPPQTRIQKRLDKDRSKPDEPSPWLEPRQECRPSCATL